MAQLLILNTDAVHKDALINERECHKQGDIIVVKDNDHIWGKQEHPLTSSSKKFWLITMTGVDVEQLQYLTVPHIEEFSGDVLLQRAWKFDIDLLPPDKLHTLTTTYMLTCEWTEGSTYIINKTQPRTLSTP